MVEETEVQNGESTRSRILNVALGLISENGFAGTSTRQLSERLGFTKAALYYHFRTKDDLLEALVAPVICDLEKIVKSIPERPSVALRRQSLDDYSSFVARHLQLINVLSNDPSVARRPALSDANRIYGEMMRLLAGENSDQVQRARVRAALGGVHAALSHMGPGDDVEIVRKAAIDAACGALGIPNPV